MFRPGIDWTLAPVTREPRVLLVEPGLANPSKKKSLAEKFVLQVNPFILVPVLIQMLVWLCSLSGKINCVDWECWCM